MKNQDSLENTSDSLDIPPKSHLENLEAVAGMAVLSTGAITAITIATLATWGVGYKIYETISNYFY